MRVKYISIPIDADKCILFCLEFFQKFGFRLSQILIQLFPLLRIFAAFIFSVFFQHPTVILFLLLFCPFQQCAECFVFFFQAAGFTRFYQFQTFLCTSYNACERKRYHSRPVNRQNQQRVQFMMELIHLWIVIFVVIKLRMIVCLHKASAGKIIYHRRNSGDRHRKIIGPCLDW